MLAVLQTDEARKPEVLIRLYETLGYGRAGPPIHVIGLAFLAFFVAQAVLGLAFTLLTNYYSARVGLRLAERFAADCFEQPYTFFLKHPVSELTHRTCSEIMHVLTICLQQAVALCGRAASIALVLGLLFLLDPVSTFVLMGSLAAIYGAVHFMTVSRMTKAGLASALAMDVATQRATDMYGSAREILLRKNSGIFTTRIRGALREHAKSDLIARTLPVLPRNVLEVSAVALLMSVPIYRSLTGQSAGVDLPMLTTFAFAGFRLLPMAQQLYVSLSNLAFHAPMAERLAVVLAEGARQRGRPVHQLDAMPQSLTLSEVALRHGPEADPVLSGVNLDVKKGEALAIVGPSGAGKSTLVDILTGLLPVTEGRILIDGTPAQERVVAWKPDVLAYVPQSPLVLFESLAANIAFGQRTVDIDPARADGAARRAGLASFIDSQPRGLDAVIGKDIENLSGGERQRVAIARALYASPALIIMDEPGSALDPPMKRQIMESIVLNRGNATLVVITHDMDMLPLFESVVFVNNGRVSDKATLEDLRRTSEMFRAFEAGQIGRTG
jgi:ATP-binding cassette, subfamily B, bacterial PglK